MLCGTLLLTFAGVLLVVAPSAFVSGADDSQKNTRRLALINPIVPPVPSTTLIPTGPTFTVTMAGGLAIPATTTTTATTGTYPSSFDSSDSSSSGSSFESSKSSEPQSFKSSGLPAEEIGSGWGTAGGATAGQLLIMICFALCYNSYAVQPILEARGTLRAMNLPDNGNDDFDNGICECLSDRWVCFHGLCCPLVRMAHTNAVAGVCGFWESVFCWCCCSFSSVGVGTCCLMVYWRMQLKAVMRVTDHALNDLCVTLFCPLLSVCQQATAVDTKLGYQVVGCCDLEWADEQDMLMNAS